jgi:N-carbamoyl-L-amino-acid hydrolase
VGAARDACAAVAREPASLASGALHDAAELARVLPAAMLFAPSRGGVSHAREEDTAEADLAVAIEAFADLVARVQASDSRGIG